MIKVGSHLKMREADFYFYKCFGASLLLKGDKFIYLSNGGTFEELKKRGYRFATL